VDLGDWYALLDALDGREADIMVEAKGKEQALAPLGVEIG
jgi:UV DNA damage endonuclease